MITTLTDTTSSTVDRRLIAMREEFGVTAQGRVLTLIIVASADDLEEPLRAAAQASHEHPCRVLVLQTEPEAESDGLDAEIRVGRDAGAGEIVVLRARGQVASSLDTLITPLLLPDAPIVTWWPAAAPSVPAQDVLGSMAQRRITDARQAEDPEAMLKRLRRGYRSGDSDLAWSRITPWRGLIASALEIPPMSAPTAATVQGTPCDPSVILMQSWLSKELGIDVIVEAGPESEQGLSGVVLTRADGDIALRRDTGDTIVMNLPGDTSDQHVSVPRRSLFESLAEELRRLDPDEVYGETLCHAFTAIEDPATFATGKPAVQYAVSADRDELIDAAASAIAEQLREAVDARGIARVVLTGGTVGIPTAARLASALQAAEVPADAIEVWWGDERFVESDSDERNDVAVLGSFVQALGLPEHHVHRMPSTSSGMGLDEAAAWYGQQLDAAGGDVPFHTRGQAFFDVLMLGVGPDGHVASLFPQHPDQKETTLTAAPVRNSPKPPAERISLTWPAVNSSRHVALFAAGAEKAEAVARAHGEIDPWACPASAVRGLESTTWYLDQESAADL